MLVAAAVVLVMVFGYHVLVESRQPADERCVEFAVDYRTGAYCTQYIRRPSGCYDLSSCSDGAVYECSRDVVFTQHCQAQYPEAEKVQ